MASKKVRYQLYSTKLCQDIHKDMVLADEPTGNLDRKNGEEIIDMLKLSNRNLKQTILLITHDEKIALEADRIITVEDGRIISDQKRR